MVTEDYVSFEIAKLLKENGFDEPCYAYWHEDENRLIFSYSMHAIRNITNPCFFGPAVPTLQMAMKWLRKIHKLEIYPFHDMLQGNAWWYRIERNTGLSSVVEKEEDDIYRTYEQACEAAIKYCLENLI